MPHPAQTIPQITDPNIVRREYAYCRPRILLWTLVGYGAYYLVRKNLSIAMPVMQDQLGINKADLGLFLTAHGLIYGVSKFFNGMLCDRSDARRFMVAGLAVSAMLNVLFGFSTAIIALGIIWMLNGWFQGMGYPPCARLLTHWFSPKELASKMAIWNASHSLGAGAIVILCGYLVAHFGSWRICFFVPAAIAGVMAVLLFMRLRDTPESVGLPGVEGTGEIDAGVPGGEHSPASFRTMLWLRVFSNKYIWVVSAANFFVYIIRYAVLDWGPMFLKEYKGVELTNAAWMVAGFEVAGLIGMLATGWLTDRAFGGRAAPVSFICMVLCGMTLFAFWKAPSHQAWLNTSLLMASGFLIYGPQALVAVIVANQATKRAAATAVGLTSVFGYASTVVSGWGLGKTVQHYGWSGAFVGLILVAGLGALLFAAALPAKAHGYAGES